MPISITLCNLSALELRRRLLAFANQLRAKILNRQVHEERPRRTNFPCSLNFPEMGIGPSKGSIPLPTWFSGISDLAGNCEIIYGAQHLRGKIFNSKNLEDRASGFGLPPSEIRLRASGARATNPFGVRRALPIHTDQERPSSARSDVTLGCGKRCKCLSSLVMHDSDFCSVLQSHSA